LNSGSPVEGDGGVAVAVTDDRSIDSGLGRGAAGVSIDLGCAGGAAGVRWIGGAAGALCCCAGGAAGARCGADANGGGSQLPWAGGVERDWSRGPDSEAGLSGRLPPDGGGVWPLGAGIEMTPLHTEQRARTPVVGTFAGSTRKIERQSGQLTFIHSLRSGVYREMPAAAPAA